MVLGLACSVSSLVSDGANWSITGFGLSFLDEISILIDWFSLKLRLSGLLLNFLNLQYSCWRWLFGGCGWSPGGIRCLTALFGWWWLLCRRRWWRVVFLVWRRCDSVVPVHRRLVSGVESRIDESGEGERTRGPSWCEFQTLVPFLSDLHTWLGLSFVWAFVFILCFFISFV